MDILSILNPESAPATGAYASAPSAAPISEHHPDQGPMNSVPPDLGILIGGPVWPAIASVHPRNVPSIPTWGLPDPVPPATYVLNSQAIMNPIQGAGPDDNTQHGILPREVYQRIDDISKTASSLLSGFSLLPNSANKTSTSALKHGPSSEHEVSSYQSWRAGGSGITGNVNRDPREIRRVFHYAYLILDVNQFVAR